MTSRAASVLSKNHRKVSRKIIEKRPKNATRREIVRQELSPTVLVLKNFSKKQYNSSILYIYTYRGCAIGNAETAAGSQGGIAKTRKKTNIY